HRSSGLLPQPNHLSGSDRAGPVPNDLLPQSDRARYQRLPLGGAAHAGTTTRGMDRRHFGFGPAAHFRVLVLPPARRHLRGSAVMTERQTLVQPEEPAVRVMGISKRYRIARSPTSGGVYDSIGRVVDRRKARAASEETTIWALHNVSF